MYFGQKSRESREGLPALCNTERMSLRVNMNKTREV